MKIILRYLCILFVIFSCECLFSTASVLAQDKKILILHSYHQEYPWTNAENKGFTQTLNNTYITSNIVFSTEYLDTKRVNFNHEYQTFFYQYLKQKYDNYTPDLIFCSDDNALSFLMKYKPELFGQVPVVFCGVNNLAVQGILDRRHYTGVFEKKEIIPNLTLVNKIIPQSDYILFIGDDTTTHKAIAQSIRDDIASQFPELTYTVLASKRLSYLMSQLKLHEKGIVFLTTIGGIKDEHDAIVPLDKAISSIVNAGNFTIISMEDVYIRDGVLGGFVTNGVSQGKKAADLTIQILNGNSPLSIPLVRESPNEYMFNYTELKKNALSISKLPEQSIILNKPPSFYEHYKIEIWFAFLFLIFQTFAIFVLVKNIEKRKKAEISLQKASDDLEQKVIGRTSELTRTNVSLSREIIERKQMEEALKESEVRFKSLHNASFGGISIHDKGIILDCNRGLSEMTGFSIKELIGMNGLELIAPKWREPVMDKILSGFEQSYDVEGLRKDSTRYDLRIRGKNIPHHGRTVRVTEFRDITENKIAEKEKINAQKLVGEQKQFALVGQVAGKMAHDFNNILSIIMGTAELSLIDCDDIALKDAFELIFEQSLRGQSLTKNLVAFAKDQEPKQEFFKINEKINLVLNLLKKDLEGIELANDNEAGVPELLADSGMVEHAVVNLLQNSIHATSKIEYPKIFIKTYCRDDKICLEIEDNGCGIPKANLLDIYKPSFTLKGSKDQTQSYDPQIKGTGYGMSNVKKYVELHNGTIEVESTFGSGTKFILSFPIIKKELTELEKERVCQELKHFEKSILLVEDEIPISSIQCRVLTHHPCNHTVDIAENGKTAIELFDENKYDLVSLDYILPGDKNGMEVYHHIREKNKIIPILFISGNIEFLESIKTLKQKDANVDHLSKPCQNKDYVAALDQLLENQSRRP